MSSFMCKPETIGMIADYIWRLRFPFMASHSEKEDSLYAPKLNGDQCTRDDVYQRLWNMNAHALTIRYTDHAVTEMVGEYESYPEVPVVEDGKLFKKFDCLLYQCDEGDIPDSTSYKELETAHSILAYQIARHTKEYEEAEWG